MGTPLRSAGTVTRPVTSPQMGISGAPGTAVTFGGRVAIVPGGNVRAGVGGAAVVVGFGGAGVVFFGGVGGRVVLGGAGVGSGCERVAVSASVLDVDRVRVPVFARTGLVQCATVRVCVCVPSESEIDLVGDSGTLNVSTGEVLIVCVLPENEMERVSVGRMTRSSDNVTLRVASGVGGGFSLLRVLVRGRPGVMVRGGVFVGGGESEIVLEAVIVSVAGPREAEIVRLRDIDNVFVSVRQWGYRP
jgi:hypothetical protein